MIKDLQVIKKRRFKNLKNDKEKNSRKDDFSENLVQKKSLHFVL